MIPKKIHYCWFGENEKPLLVIECIKSWQKYCPDYELMEWNSKNYDVHKNKYMEQAYQAKRWGLYLIMPDWILFTSMEESILIRMSN